ncbi:hypothetical protein SK128_004611 [Halocaridina rubra]|uniref:Uncharacterized protein n=1 Tax=Halocaridina rubra TaxID=373956 RepID=A0AAN9FV18_HALRR
MLQITPLGKVLLGWCIAFITGVAVVFGMYNYNQLGDFPGYHWAASIFYAGLHRFAWGVALAWVGREPST